MADQSDGLVEEALDAWGDSTPKTLQETQVNIAATPTPIRRTESPSSQWEPEAFAGSR
jgi:hypothetical protein